MPRLCLGLDNTHVYAIRGNGMTSYDISNGTTATFTGGILEQVNFFQDCMIVGDKTYTIVQDRNAVSLFQSYQFLYTTQVNQLPIKSGQPNYIIKLTHLDIFSIISFSPVKNMLSTTTGNDNSEVCVLISPNNPSFQGLYQYCANDSTQIPFNDEEAKQAKPLITVNQAMSSVYLFGYPNRNTINVYSNLDDLGKPDASYYFADGVPSSGSVQAINSNATEFILFDYNRTIYHITLPNPPTASNSQPSASANSPPKLINSNNKRQQQQQPVQQNVISKSYALENDLNNGDVITLSNQHIFSVSDGATDIQFKEAPVLVSAIELPNSPQPTSPTVNQSTDSGGMTTTIIICASVIGGAAFILIIVLIYVFCYRKKKRQSHQLSTSSHQTQQRYRMLDEEMVDEPPPVYTRYPEGDNNRLQINTSNNNNNIIEQEEDYNQYYDGSNQTTNRNRSLRRGIDTFITRMISLRRSPQSPSASIFSFFSNGMNPSSPVEDIYQKVKKANFPTSVNNLLEPSNNDLNDSLILNGRYHLLEDRARFDENLRIPGYTTRTIQHIKNNKIKTIHYYLKDQRDVFLKNINVSVALRTSKRIVRHDDALSLEKPTEPSSYQHFWLSSPCISKQSLHYLVHHDQQSFNTDDFYFISLSTLSLLLCLQDLHTADYCHLGLSLRSFFYEKPSSFTDWYITGFDQALLIGHSDNMGLKLDIYSAPELITAALDQEVKENSYSHNHNNHNSDGQQNQSLLNLQCYGVQGQFEMDIWSLGCILYEMATGKPLFNDFHQLIQLCEQSPIVYESTGLIITPLQTHLNQAFEQAEAIHPSIKGCLELLLQVNPQDRVAIQKIIEYWVEVNQLNDELD